MRGYFDTSALAKGYLHEPGTKEVRDLLESCTAVATCTLGLTEVVSVLCRNVRERRLPKSQYLDIRATFLADMADLDIVLLTESVFGRSIHLLETSALAGADALHIASAIEWEAEIFVSSDARQLEAARRAGLSCEAV